MKTNLRRMALAVLTAMFIVPIGVSGGAVASVQRGGESKIVSVTVYADRAEVTRRADVVLPKGEVELAFTGLPASLDNDSVQVWGTGRASASLEGVTVDMERPPEVPEGKVADIERRIQELNDRKKLLESKRKAANARVRMMSEVRVVARRKDAPTSWGGLEEIERIARTMISGLRKAYAERREIDSEMRGIARELSILEKELRKIRTPSGGRTKELKVTLAVKRPGSLSLTFSYILPGARWTPFYDIRALTEKDELEIVGHARIVQKTGEDWTDVKLSVSTAKPHIGGTPPKVEPIYLTFYYPRPDASPTPMPASRAVPEESISELGVEEEADAYDEPAVIAGAEVKQTGTAVFFEVKQKKTIPSDGEPHKVPISVDRLKAVFKHASWPEDNSRVFLRAETKNRTDHPFVGGEANVFVGSSFIGTTKIDDWAVTEEKTISLGVDQGVRIKRKTIKRDEKEVMSKRAITCEYSIMVTNYKKKTVTIDIFDRLPISRQDDIEVRLENVSPEPVGKNDRGIIKWRFDLKPGEEKNISLSYTVRFPKNRRVVGLP